MITSILSGILSAWFAFLLPSYSTFKVLSHKPLSEPDLQRWSTYWTVVGAFVAFEHVAEWSISWLPFYWEIKTLFLLYLSLPQTQGSTYIYNTYLQPFLVKNEDNLDAGLISAQQNTFNFFKVLLTTLWEFVWNILNKKPLSAQPPTPGTRPNSTFDPSAGLSLESAMGLWRTYGSSVMNALAPGTASAFTSAPVPAGPTVSTGSFDNVPAERNLQSTKSEPRLPDPSIAAPNHSSAPPSFTEPQLS